MFKNATSEDLCLKKTDRGEDIFISVWNLHRSPLHWDDAEEFNPERWPLDGPNPNETNQNFRYKDPGFAYHLS